MIGLRGIWTACVALEIPIVMFNFLKRILGTNGATTTAPETNAPSARTATAPRPAEKAAGGMEVASLSLRAILEKLPPDLKAIVNQLPDSEVKIVLPVSTIMKQLSGGAVKMSLASLLRQSPPGVFRKTEIEEKRMVDVPLAEIFKTVNPSRLQRRADQRQYDVPANAAGLFGHDGNTRSVTPPTAAPKIEPAKPASESVSPAPQATPRVEAPIAAEPKIEPMKVLKMPGLSIGPAPEPSNGNGHAAVPAPKPISVAKVEATAEPNRLALHGELALSFVEIASTWPEGIRGELTFLTGDTRLVLPVSAVSPGLQKGKLSFPWSQVRQWFRPALTSAVSIPDDTELIFPLKIVAPAFVAATGATKRREGVVVDQTLPDFFGPTAGQAGKPAAPAAPPIATVEPVPEPIAEATPTPTAEVKFSFVRETTPPPVAATEVAVPSPTPTAEPDAEIAPAPSGGLKLSIASDSPAPATIVAEVTAAAPVQGGPLTLGELFNQPGKSSWTPGEMVAHTCELPGVAGVVVALEEGLVVAHQLPEGFAAETFAAFMPQIFGKLGRYAEEMKLGDTNEITFQSASGACHFVRSGKVFFATLGRPGEKLPAGLKLIPAELAAHHH